MTRRILALGAAQAALSIALIATGATGQGRVTLPTLLGFAAAFALAGMAPLQVEVGRHACTITLTEAVLVLAAFRVPSAAIVAAAICGELAACLAHRQPALKLAYNVAATAGATAVAAAVITTYGPGSATSPRAWLVVAAGVAAFAWFSLVSTAAVLAVVQHQRMSGLFISSLGPAALAAAVSCSIGLVAVVLGKLHPAAPGLLVPVVVAVVLAVRQVALHQSEHLRFARLYAASRRSASLQAFDDVLTVLADEARSLVAGTVAICAAPATDGGWRAMVVGDTGSVAADDSVLDALRALAPEGESREWRAAHVPEALLSLAPGASGIVVGQTSTAGGEPGTVLAVLRQIEPDRNGAERATVLGAFAAHAGLVVDNARLLDEVETALARQLDLHRQKDEFVSIVSHELRTPLTAMLGAITMLQKQGARVTDEQRLRLHDMASRHGVRLQRLIEDLLLVAADQRAEVSCEPVDLEVVAFASGLAKTLGATHQVSIATKASSDVVSLRTDAGRLQQIVTHLVDNAVKYGDGSDVSIAVVAVAHSVEVAVIDHGPGIAPADRGRIFERFVQLDSSATRTAGGTGIGLSLCRTLATALGGSLRVEDTPGGGCTFVLELPAPLAEAPAPGPAVVVSADLVSSEHPSRLVTAACHGGDR